MQNKNSVEKRQTNRDDNRSAITHELNSTNKTEQQQNETELNQVSNNENNIVNRAEFCELPSCSQNSSEKYRRRTIISNSSSASSIQESLQEESKDSSLYSANESEAINDNENLFNSTAQSFTKLIPFKGNKLIIYRFLSSIFFYSK